MDPRVFCAIAENDIPSFTRLVQEDEGILEQRTIGPLNTVLHLASMAGHINLVMEIVKLRPEMTAVENKKLEIPLHIACRQGDIEVVMLLLKTNPWLSCKFNSKIQSALFIACSNGHLKVVKVLLNQPWCEGIEDEAQLNSLHVAASKGHADIGGHLLNLCPNLAHDIDENGYSPLHDACRWTCIDNNNAAKLAVRKSFMTKMEINYQNYEGHKALDILDQAESTSEV